MTTRGRFANISATTAPKGTCGMKHPDATLTMKTLHAKAYSPAKIARMLDCSYHTVHRYVNNGFVLPRTLASNRPACWTRTWTLYWSGFCSTAAMPTCSSASVSLINQLIDKQDAALEKADYMGLSVETTTTILTMKASPTEGDAHQTIYDLEVNVD